MWPEDGEVGGEHVPLDPDPVPAPLHLPQPVPRVPGSVLGQGVCSSVTILTPCWEQEQGEINTLNECSQNLFNPLLNLHKLPLMKAEHG